jgi:hypothetical protein
MHPTHPFRPRTTLSHASLHTSSRVPASTDLLPSLLLQSTSLAARAGQFGGGAELCILPPRPRIASAGMVLSEAAGGARAHAQGGAAAPASSTLSGGKQPPRLESSGAHGDAMASRPAHTFHSGSSGGGSPVGELATATVRMRTPAAPSAAPSAAGAAPQQQRSGPVAAAAQGHRVPTSSASIPAVGSSHSHSHSHSSRSGASMRSGATASSSSGGEEATVMLERGGRKASAVAAEGKGDDGAGAVQEQGAGGAGGTAAGRDAERLQAAARPQRMLGLGECAWGAEFVGRDGGRAGSSILTTPA